MPKKKPKRCWGPAKHQHAAGCHPARPLCRWMRKVQQAKYGVCNCPAYHFPHRHLSGACGDPSLLNSKWEVDAKVHDTMEAVPF